jgi:uncharacterized protein (DUF1800 family)
MPPIAPPSIDRIDPAEAWAPWQPSANDPWNRTKAAHLYRRSAFGASAAELTAAEKNGYQATLALLLNGAPGADERDKMLETQGLSIARRENAFELRGWWIYTMLHSLHPVREKLTLFWHNHFATSIAKVRRTTLLFEQNRLLRANAIGKFGPFLLAMSKDAAMLDWLDSNSNVKAHPNENYAREVMELFSLGVGNYTENDVREAARAFTGWHTDDDQFEFDPTFHDDGPKQVLGRAGTWNGDDVVRILLDQPACGRFLVRKLFRNYISETQAPSDRQVEYLAERLRKSDYDIGLLVRTMLSSRLFYSPAVFQQRVKSPVEFVTGAVRATTSGSVPQQALVTRLDAMGQNLFEPPNVKGWPGGSSWLNSASLVARGNFAQALATGTLWKDVPRFGRFEAVELTEVDDENPEKKKEKKPPAPEEAPPRAEFDPARLTREAKATSPEDVVRVLIETYLPGGVRASARRKLVEFVAQGKPTGPALDRRVRETVHALLSLPEYQLA